MTSPFRFRFRVPEDAAPGATRLRVVTYTCQSCFRESTGWARLDPCAEVSDMTTADLSVLILPAPPGRAGVKRFRVFRVF